MTRVKSLFRAAVLLPLVAGSALAGENFDGKVQSVAGGRVELVATAATPDWVQQGQLVQAFGWEAQIRQVSGNSVVLQLDPLKTRNVKVGHAVSIRAPAVETDEPQMCGS